MFAITVRQRAGSIGTPRLTAAQERFDAGAFRAAETHDEAYKLLTAIDDVGQKIANEYLRKVVHAFEFRDSWVEDLRVPLDTHVTRALIDPKCIHESNGSRTDRTTVAAVFNPNSGSNPSTRIPSTTCKRRSNGSPKHRELTESLSTNSGRNTSSSSRFRSFETKAV